MAGVAAATSGVRGAARARLAGSSLTAAAMKTSRFSWDRSVPTGGEDEGGGGGSGLRLAGIFFEAPGSPALPVEPFGFGGDGARTAARGCAQRREGGLRKYRKGSHGALRPLWQGRQAHVATSCAVK